MRPRSSFGRVASWAAAFLAVAAAVGVLVWSLEAPRRAAREAEQVEREGMKRAQRNRERLDAELEDLKASSGER